MTNTTKLHEILAVEGGLEATSKKLTASSKKQFTKENLFLGGTKTLEMFDSSQSHLNTTETQKLETTVDENLQYALASVAKYWDSVLQKDSANQIAKADIKVGDTIISKDVPATTLLGLENKLASLRALFEAIPTLAPGVNWTRNENDMPGVYTATDLATSFKTANDIDFRVLYEATKEHPAQVTEMKVVKNIGKYKTTRTSGMYTAYQKAKVLENIDTLVSAIKKARQRANNAIVEDKHIGNDLIDFIFENKNSVA